jgi:hypothetical protein
VRSTLSRTDSPDSRRSRPAATEGSETSFPLEMRTYILRRRRVVNMNLLFIPPVCSALTFVSPGFGYCCLAYVSLFIFLTPTAAEHLQQIMKVSEPETTADG